jgi:hypothetical protein
MKTKGLTGEILDWMKIGLRLRGESGRALGFICVKIEKFKNNKK